MIRPFPEEQAMWHSVSDPNWVKEFLDYRQMFICLSDLNCGVSGSFTANFLSISDKRTSFYNIDSDGNESDLTLEGAFESLKWRVGENSPVDAKEFEFFDFARGMKYLEANYIVGYLSVGGKSIRVAAVFHEFPPIGFYLPCA